MAAVDSDNNWYLAQLKPNCANIAIQNLNRQGMAAYLPLIQETKRRGTKFVTVTSQLFPGYLFVSFNSEDGLWRKVNSTYGITRLVSFGQKPAVVPQGLVARLMQCFDVAGSTLAAGQPQPGDTVKLTQGPFASFVAEVEKVTPDRRVWVLLDFIGARTRMAVDADHVRLN